MSSDEDKKIIEGILNGNALVLSNFYRRNLPKIKDFVSKNSGNIVDAEDVFQDAMVFIYQKLRDKSFELTSSIHTYFFAVCRNFWMNKLRKQRKILFNYEFSNISDYADETILSEIQKKEQQFLFQKHFLKLGNGCQDILSFFFLGYSMSKISGLMGYSEGYARKKKFECKKKLIAMIKKDFLYNELTSFLKREEE